MTDQLRRDCETWEAIEPWPGPSDRGSIITKEQVKAAKRLVDFASRVLDPPDDVREAVRREMEKAIESASSGLHDSQSWWDDYYSDIYGKPLIEVLLDNLEKVMKRHYLTLTEPSE